MGVLTAGIILTFVFLIANYGLIDFSLSQIALQKFSLSQLSSITDGALINWATIIALGFGNLIAIDFGSRIFSAKSPKDAVRGCYLGGFLSLILGIPFSLLIFYILQLNISVVSDTPVLITFATKILPPSIAAVLIAGLVNSAMSTVDGGMLSMGNILTRNILQIKPETNTKEPEEAEKTALYFLRLSLLPIAFAAMIFAILMPSPGALLSIAFDITFAALLVPFVFAFTKYNDAQAALYAIIVGGVSRIIFAILTPTLFGLPNPLYIQNNFIDPSLDGLGTILSPLLALIVYIYIFKANKNLANAK